MQGTVSEMGQSQKGNPKVKINGQWYSIKTNQGYGVGSMLDFEASDFQINGKTFKGIDRFAVVNGQAQDAWKPSPTVGLNSQPSAPGYTEPERMFVSNIVAAAVTSGKISDPIDLPAWVNAAMFALRNAKADLPMADKADF